MIEADPAQELRYFNLRQAMQAGGASSAAFIELDTLKSLIPQSPAGDLRSVAVCQDGSC